MNLTLASLVASLVLASVHLPANAGISVAFVEEAAGTAVDSTNEIPSRRIDGLWDEHITLVNCASGVVLTTFRATNLFGRDGSLTAINNQPPSSSSAAMGTWWRTRYGGFAARMRFFRFNPDGSYAGLQQVTRSLSLVSGSQELNGSIQVEVFDANDHLLQTGCGTEEGTRVSG